MSTGVALMNRPAVQMERTSAKLHCQTSSTRNAHQDSAAAASTAERLFKGMNGDGLRRGRTGGEPLCVFGFAAQCVAFNQAEAARFFERLRDGGARGSMEEQRQQQERFAQRLRDLLSHTRRSKLSNVLVYGKEAQIKMYEEVQQSQFRSLVRSPPVAAILRRNPQAATATHPCGLDRSTPLGVPAACMCHMH